MRKIFYFIILVFLPCIFANDGNRLEKFVGSPSKIVWVQADKTASADIFVEKSDNHSLMGLDTSNDKGIQKLLPAKWKYRKPIISPDGRKIVFFMQSEGNAYITDWTSKSTSVLTTGVPLAFFYDKKNDIQWLYLGRKIKSKNGHVNSEEIHRVQLYNPSKSELVWSGVRFGMDNFMLSRDGNRSEELFPWPRAGLGDLEKKDWQFLGLGCWPSLSPDNSKILALFRGSHRDFMFYSLKPAKKWTVITNKEKALFNHEVYHPKWSNHVNFMTLTGPYSGKSPNQPDIFAGGDNVEVYVTKLSNDLSKVEKYFRLTNNNQADFYPYMWVKDGAKSKLDLDLVLKDKPDYKALKNASNKRWPEDPQSKGIVFLWYNLNSQNRFKSPATGKWVENFLQFHGKARPYLNWQADLSGGYATIDKQQTKTINSNIVASNQVALEVSISAKENDFNTSTIIHAYNPKTKKSVLELGQRGNELLIKLNTNESTDNDWHSLYFMKKGSLHNVLISYKNKNFRVFVDGKSVLNNNKTGHLFGFNDCEWTFGNSFHKNNDWRGAIENLAIYNLAVRNTQEAETRNFLLLRMIGMRKKSKQFKAKLKLLKKGDDIAVEAINEYKRALSVFTYKIGRKTRARFPKKYRDKSTINVAEWVILDRKKVNTSKKAGEKYNLVLEEYQEHKQLSSERMETEIFDIDFYNKSIPLD